MAKLPVKALSPKTKFRTNLADTTVYTILDNSLSEYKE